MSASESLKQYYDEAWKQLQTDAKSFAKAYPEQAQHLHLDAPFGRDPNIDHLLQGCTYLAAQIHRYVDKTTNIIPEQWAQVWWPQSVQDVPSYSVAQFRTTSFMPQKVAAGTLLLSQPVSEEKIVCRFETVSPVMVHAIELVSVTCHEQRDVVSLSFETTSDRACRLNELGELSFFISGEMTHTCEWYRYLRRHCERIVLRLGDNEFPLSISYPLEQWVSRAEQAFESGFLAHQCLFDYFVFPQQFLFFTLSGFDPLPKILASKSFKICFYFDKRWPDSLMLDPQVFALNATVIVNRFNMPCEPVQRHAKQSRYPLYVERENTAGYRLLSVSGVEGIEQTTGKKTRYQALSPSYDQSPTFMVSREKDEEDKYYLQCFHTPTHSEILSMDAWVCNGFYPHRFVPAKALSLSPPLSNRTCQASNVLVPTPLLSPPHNLTKTLLSLLTLNTSDIFNADTFKHLLRTFHWGNEAQHHQRINSIQSIEAKLKHQVIKGAFVRVLDISMRSSRSGFASTGDAFFFGDVLYTFFKAHAAIHERVGFTMHLFPQDEVLQWNG